MSDSIHNVIFDGDIDRVRSILNTSINIETINSDGDTPFLTCCTYRPFIEVVELLIDHGANINATNAKGESALSIAVGSKNGSVIDILLKNNAEVNVVSDDGQTPLFRAAYKEQVTYAREILRRGANPNLNPSNPEDGTVLLWAVSTGDLELVRMLLSHEANINSPGVLHSAINHIHIMDYLIKEGADINKKGAWGSTALHMAAYKCEKDVVEFLVNNGADVEVTDDKDGQTPYEWALEGGCHCEIIKDLLKIW
jgi:ankyrin repeat protein